MSDDSIPDVTQPDVRERIAQLKVMLREVEAEIIGDDPPPDVLRDFKGAVDELRTSLWAAMTRDESEGYRSVLAQLRSARFAEMLEGLMADFEAGTLPHNTPSFLHFREQVIAAAERLRQI